MSAEPSHAALQLKTSRQLLNFALPANAVLHQQPIQQQAPATAVKAPKSGKRRRQPAITTDIEQQLEHCASSASFVPALVPLGGHSVAAIREGTDAHTNGHQPSSLEVTILDTMYGCVQSVVPVHLPKSTTSGAEAAAGDGSQLGKQQQVFRLSSGFGDLVLLSHDAVWSISIPVSSLCYAMTAVTWLAYRLSLCCWPSLLCQSCNKYWSQLSDFLYDVSNVFYACH